MIVGAGDGPCVVIAVGAREHQDDPESIRYPVDDAALRHRAGVREETGDPRAAYAHLPPRRWSPYREGWLSERVALGASPVRRRRIRLKLHQGCGQAANAAPGGSRGAGAVARLDVHRGRLAVRPRIRDSAG